MALAALLDPDREPRPDATSLAASLAGARERRIALAVVLLSLLAFAAVAPFAKVPIGPITAFMPIYESALVVNDLITALLLFGQARIGRSKAVLLLAGGYFFTALVTVVHGLTFPGLITPTGLLTAGPQSTAWLYMAWHGLFPVFVVAYALLAGSRREALQPSTPSGLAIAWTCAAVVCAVVGLVALVTAGHAWLPNIMQGNRYTPSMTLVVSAVWLAPLAALVVLWRRGSRSVLDLWLMVVMCAWLLDIALSAVLNAGRFDLGFYAGRAYGLLAASFVLGILLLENGVLHARLLQSHAHERRRAADLLALSERLESLNEALARSNHQLQEQTRLKSEFLANMSHELRTPLNAIIGFSDLLKEGLATEIDKQKSFARHIFQGGHHLLALINDILDLSKIEAGKVEIVLEPVSLEQALTDAMELLAPQAEAKRIRLEIEPHGVLGTLWIDQRRLKQILLNLMSNAMKFTPAGGHVRLRADIVARQRASQALPGFAEGLRMTLPAGDFETFVEISVSDTGIGIAPEDLRTLFAPFTQVPNALTRSAEGTGLGLVMVHRLAELHGGTVAVTSQAQRGSCFTVWLPWREGAAAPAGEAVLEPAAAPNHGLALVVEDDEAAADLMRAQLEEEGFVVRRVASAEEALSLVGQCHPALIALDILLPGMDGWEFLARLKQTPAWEAIPVVVVSVVADQGKGFSLGAAQVLQKPVAQEALAKVLERLGLAANRQRDVTVLVIDDEPPAVELLAAHLHERDYLVLRATGGHEGIELARRYRPDLITLDLEMPEVNGFDVVHALKANPMTAQIPIIVVTARDLSIEDRAQLNGHIQDIVGKAEFNHGRFINEVQRALSKVG